MFSEETAQVHETLALSVPALLRRRAAETPCRLALSARSLRGARNRLSYEQLVQDMDAVARGLAARGLEPGHRIAVFLTNEAGVECMLTALGALALGAAVIPLNTRLADEGLRQALELVEPHMTVTETAQSDRLAALGAAGRLLLLDPAAAGAEDGWPEPDRAPSGPPSSAPDDADLLGCLLFTSGTTGRPKAVMHTHRTMLAAGLCCGRALGLEPDDIYQGAFPFFTSSALNIAAMSCWVHGAGLVLEEPLDNAGRLHLIATERATVYHGVPSVVSFMLEEYSRGGYDLHTLRRIAYGGAPMPPDVSRRIRRAWPWLDQVQIFGSTESGPSGTVLVSEQMEAKAGSIGRPMALCRIDVVSDDGESLPPGETGEIAITGPAVAAGYFRDAEATSATFAGRRVLTGDVGMVDIDNYVFLTDRKKDLINRGGLKISSIAVEAVLHRHALVREAAVVAVPHPRLGEDVAACIVTVPGASLDAGELAAFCRDKLADYAVPRRWLFVDELPKNPMGKVLKTELRGLAQGGFSACRAGHSG